MPKKKKPKFEEVISIIDVEIIKRRGKWNLTAINWMDFDDVSQILRINIYKKCKLRQDVIKRIKELKSVIALKLDIII